MPLWMQGLNSKDGNTSVTGRGIGVQRLYGLNAAYKGAALQVLPPLVEVLARMFTGLSKKLFYFSKVLIGAFLRNKKFVEFENL